jgi:putative phage-type endonuclease
MAIYHYFPQRDREWYAIRAGIPTASEMSKIITSGGKDPSKARPSTQAGAYMNLKLAEWILGMPIQNDYESEHMVRGQENEPVACSAFEFQTGLTTTEVGFVTTDDGMMGASPDRLVGDHRLLEIKCPAIQTHIGYLLDNDKLIEEYRVQVQSQLMVCDDREMSHMVAWNEKLPTLVLDVPRDEDFIAKIRAASTAFVQVMLQKREELGRRFGPFVRPEPEQKKEALEDGLGFSEADIAWFGDPNNFDLKVEEAK